VDAAIGLFSRRGFSGTTTREIAQAVGVTEALIFRHFARKHDLYAAILAQSARLGDTRQWLFELKALVDAGDDAGLLTTLFRRLIERHDHDSAFLRLMLYSALEDHALARLFYAEQVEPLQQFLLAFVVERQRAGVFRRCDAAAVVRAILALPSHHVLATRVLRSFAPSVNDAAAINTFTEIVLHGLRVSGRPSPAGRHSRRRGRTTVTREGKR